MPDNEQLTLPFDEPTKPESYEVTIACGPVHQEVILRRHTAKTPEDALSLAEALRDTYAGRESVTWRDEEIGADGRLYGLAPGGVVYVIAVTPPLDPQLV